MLIEIVIPTFVGRRGKRVRYGVDPHAAESTTPQSTRRALTLMQQPVLRRGQLAARSWL